MKTTCADCIFKISDEEKQTSCYLGRLEKFQEKGKAEIQEDGNYVINTLCNACRNQDWANDEDSLEESANRVKNDIKIQNDFIVMGKPETSIDDYIKQTKSILKQEIIPRVIIYSVCDYPVYHSLKNEVSKYIDLDKTHVYVNMAFSPTLDMRIFEAARRSTHSYFSVFMVDEEIPNGFNSKLNDMITEELRVISAILPEEGYHGLTIQKLLFKKITQNATTGIDYVIDEIREIAKETKEESYLLEWNKFSQE